MGGAGGVKLHNLIYARRGEAEAGILRTFLLEGEVRPCLSAFWRGALGIERERAELLRPSHRAGPGQDPHNRRGRFPSDG